MNAIVLLTAMTASSGIFGGGRASCAGGQCGRTYAAPVRYAAPACAGGQCAGYVAQAPAYGYAAPAYGAAPAPRMAMRPTYTPMAYYPTASACPNGTCYRR
jgi:hypothetical protein